ncbi:cytochrome c oxidase assembly protein [Kitasatospora aureofaciens]|uniref:cytochrome c oxidase assembly protein n=1 Tax=Kitasatospora aureofaciens TaxID=1894 RepID=UPI0033C12D5E
MLEWLLPALVLLGAAASYLLLAQRARRRNPVRGRSRWRTTSFLTGAALLGVALLPPVAPFAHEDFRAHMVQHGFAQSLGGSGPSGPAAAYYGPGGTGVFGAAQRKGRAAGAFQPAHDLAQRGGVEGAGEVADGLVVGVGEGVEAGAVEGV